MISTMEQRKLKASNSVRLGASKRGVGMEGGDRGRELRPLAKGEEGGEGGENDGEGMGYEHYQGRKGRNVQIMVKG